MLSDEWLHQTIYPPTDPTKVDTLVCDGHEKVGVKLCTEEKKHLRAGRSSKQKRANQGGNGKRVKRSRYGWFMVAEPRSGRILSVSQMNAPENNAIVFESIEKIIEVYPKAKTMVIDKACKVEGQGRKRVKLRQLTTWAVDKFHAKKGHTKKCSCNPYSHPSIMRKLRGVNTSVCEQIFSWFRNYKGSFNTMTRFRHCFIVLYYVRRHNALVAAGDTIHLNAFSAKNKIVQAFRKGKASSRPPHCLNKRKQP